MAQKRHRVDRIFSKLRRADVVLGKGKKVPEVCKLIGIAEQTYYRWHFGALFARPMGPLLPPCCSRKSNFPSVAFESWYHHPPRRVILHVPPIGDLQKVMINGSSEHVRSEDKFHLESKEGDGR